MCMCVLTFPYGHTITSQESMSTSYRVPGRVWVVWKGFIWVKAAAAWVCCVLCVVLLCCVVQLTLHHTLAYVCQGLIYINYFTS